MRHISRLPLSQGSLQFLKEKRADLVLRRRSKKSQLKSARALWSAQRNRAFQEIKATLEKMSSGLEDVIRQAQFSSVLVSLLAVAQSPGASLLRPACLDAIRARPEIKTWV
jgi:hypothetical protein